MELRVSVSCSPSSLYGEFSIVYQSTQLLFPSKSNLRGATSHERDIIYSAILCRKLGVSISQPLLFDLIKRADCSQWLREVNPEVLQ